MRDDDVAPQSIPPLLTRSGERFELRTEDAARNGFTTLNFSTERERSSGWKDDNERFLEIVRTLPVGEVVVLFQVRLRVDINGWLLRGDADLLRIQRDDAGQIRVLVADMKSTTTAKVEHRLQVAFYHEMLAALFARQGIDCASIQMGILFRGFPDGERVHTDAEQIVVDAQRADALRLFNVPDALLEVVDDPESYIGSVQDLVTGPQSTALRVATRDFDDVPYHLTYKCDGCLYNEFCMKWSAAHDDLSLLPHLTLQDKSALRNAGVTMMAQLAGMKQPADERGERLVPTHETVALAEQLAATWPVGPRLDELIHRARRYRNWKQDEMPSLPWIPSKGYGSLPYVDANHNPNLVRIYIDAQHDYLNNRIYMLGALLVGCENGVEVPERRRSVVTMTDGVPELEEQEERLFVEWITQVMQALGDIAAPDADGKPRAPIHLIFYNQFEQRLLLDGLSRHFLTILGATPLYDFMTQLAAFDSPLATFLDQEIRDHKNYPMVCQSLQAVAASLRFDWNQPEPYRQIFRARLFDFWGKLDRADDDSAWYTNRSRFNSQIPLEYAYAAWGDLGTPEDGDADDYARYRGVTLEQIRGFHSRRLEAMERVAQDFRGNRQTVKSAFDIPALGDFEDRSRSLAEALKEFVTIERHVVLGAWKSSRNLAPERRVLSGETWVVRYLEDDQEPGIAEQNRENELRRQLKELYRAEYLAERPEAKQVRLSKEQRAESDWKQDGMQVWLRLETEGVGCGIDEQVGLSSFKIGDRLLLSARWTVDSRLPVAEQYQFTPTPKQMLYGPLVTLKQIMRETDRDGRTTGVRVLVEMTGKSFPGRAGYAFPTMDHSYVPFAAGQSYMLDSDANDWYGSFCAEVVDGLADGEPNAIHDRLEGHEPEMTWPSAAQSAQEHFLLGLDALRLADADGAHEFEASKRAYIGHHGDDPMLLVQGPPGTGKSYSTAFALFARMQGALAAGLPFRVFVTCKTHAATDVLLDNVLNVQRKLAAWQQTHPDIFAAHFDWRLVHVPLFRMAPREVPDEPIIGLYANRDKPPGTASALARIMDVEHCFVGSAPAGTRRLVKDNWPKDMFGHEFYDCLVLDEASQMNLPEAAMAALGLANDGRLIVVGDHRQMPPIVKHDWSGEPRRTFQEYRAFESLFETLLPRGLPMIKFEESFRLHADMAEFLRQEIYRHDGIHFHSGKQETLAPVHHHDPFVAAVLDPAYPLVVIVHDEARSQLSNEFERTMIAPVLKALADEPYHLDPREGLGVVVPHRAQRAAMQDEIDCLSERDPVTNLVTLSAVDTVERFQGDERKVVVYSATESDPQYLLAASKFLMDPRRLTVALSRAKQKMIVVASHSVFSVFSADEETFENAQLWKNLLRRTCTVPLWEGTLHGQHVQVWGNQSTFGAGEIS